LAIIHNILTGYANGDVHVSPLPSHQDPSAAASMQMATIGELSNAGFRTVVATLWEDKVSSTAGIGFAAVWQQNEAKVVVRPGDEPSIAPDLFVRWANRETEPLRTEDLLKLCGYEVQE